MRVIKPVSPNLTLNTEQRRQARRACERLFDDAGEREAMRVEVAGALQEAVLEDCTFQPQINPQSDVILETTGYRPIHER